MNRITFLILLILLTSCSGSVNKDLANERIDIRYKKSKIDPQFGSVRCSLTDKKGNLWFGTMENGLYRYDGKSFKQYSIKDGLDCNNIYCILEDNEERFWVGTEKGLCLYNGKTFDKIQIPLPRNHPANKNPHYQNHWVYCMLQAKSGKLWFATIDGVFIYDGQSFTHFPINEAVNGFLTSNDMVERILEDNTGNMWLGGRTNEGVFRYDGNSIVNINLEALIQGQNGPRPKPHKWAWPQLQDKNGNIWFSNWGGVYRYDGTTFTSFSSKDGLPVTMVARIIEDKKGNYWFCGDGLFRYNGNTIESFKAKDGKANIGGWSILEDANGNLWVGTKENGLYIFDGRDFNAFSE